MDELKLYQLEVEETYHEGHPFMKKYCIYAPNEEWAEVSANRILYRWKDKMKLQSIEIKTVKEVKPKMDRLLTGGIE